MKKFFFMVMITIFALSVFTPISTQVHAEQNDTVKGFVPLTDEKSKPFIPMTDEQLEKIRNSNEDYDIELTYEQAVKRTAELTGKSIDQIKKEYPNTESSYLKKSNGVAVAAASTCNWHETSTTHTVKSYNAKLIVIVKACRDGSFGWVDTNAKPMLQEFQAGSKYFQGTIQVDLESTGYYYVVNGSFYNNTTVTHTGTTGANTVWTATYAVSSTSNYYGSLYTGVKWKQVSP
ncbi:hypothetical protein [Geobacillus sp. LYN3]|uniref:hypothetical protein n=2 Tax=unclassified Geobacillus TaxID=2642459 RepID=UPI000BE3FAFA|nr:hypothetical protein [Geobacillus sp. LYN3]PDM40139.1 hypothetical protein CN643_06470 [Parageobacillus yumthangensis]PUF88745.1 hypothetical protein DCC82_06685 [Geobacillus sp. LYN3]RDV22384.1 hypothetical protein DXK91_08840 [Parageobacillus toebii]TXK90316.1 hypothetical protein FVE24_12260 [Parageobacillus sp. SY1]